ncbi:F510_1955 family glycosylhydrolase [Blastococcus goldschmidtiae]|uniref:Exo-alpha-sialidase n=1 Tax=Blastococcus goldschmidtiae TaxID=3075546 RepID=A0ABU2K603_9ACTN|nr:exo-alpha-sialidase [Blastococcus sp. DSM 46792]MDT0275583.1 exo-alpha-sialidase [Blastococcus sp. DSM 46792]
MAIAGALLAAGCTGDAGDAAAGPVGDDLTLEHVHGLGVDPADGALYAGTHYGLMKVSADGDLTRVADRIQDFMGFTVVGPEHYLASGHPGEGQSGPSNLGLIESTDGGQTWTTLSLAGEADFHALDATRGQIYGHSGGRLLVSENGTEWTDRGEMNIADLAVDPYVSSRVLVTTEEGLALSEDSGETFEVVPESPVLLLIDFSLSAGEAVGISPEGIVYASTDGGLTWMERGEVGAAPEALGVNGEDVYVAVDGAILISTDGGATFTDLYRGE